MEFIVRSAKAGDAESIGNLAAEFIEYLRSLGDEAEQKFDSAVYLRDGLENIVITTRRNYESRNAAD